MLNNQLPVSDDGKLAFDADGIIAEAKKRLKLCQDADGENHSKAIDDLNFLNGDQWDQESKRERELDKRPCLTINRLPTFLHQITNDQRQNRPSIKVHPVDSGADIETAKVIQGMIRHIEYNSSADVCYDTAVNSAAAIGFGYFRLVTDYCDEKSFDQDIKFKRIRNPFTVYFDPMSQEADGSDAMFCIITSKMSRTEFTSSYPNANPCETPIAQGEGGYADWIFPDQVRVAEYYRIENKPATLIRLSNGEEGWEDELIELPIGVSIIKRRRSFKRTVMWYKITALEVLEKAEIPCRWIPVFPVYGDELDIDGKVNRSGMIRNAKDPAKMYNYWMTCATEEVALRPKTPYIGAEGQFEGYEAVWQQANRRSLPFIEYKPVTLDGQLAPAPQRQPTADIPSGMLAMAMHASDNIKATTGIFDAALGAQGNETSGKAIVARQKEGDVSNFHFSDNLVRSIRHAGRCIISMIPTIYDMERVVRIMGEDGVSSHAEINKPMDRPEKDEKTGAIKTVLNDMKVGKYDVTVSAGPSYSTLRQEAADAMIQFGQSWPKLMDVAGDKVVKSMDWPGADEIAERIKRTIPPQLLGDEDKDENSKEPTIQTPQGEIPIAQASQAMAQMHDALSQSEQHMQILEQELQQAKAGIQKAQIDAQSRENVARINAESRQDVEELKGMISMLLQKMQPPQILAADVAEDIRSDDGPSLDYSAMGNRLPDGGNSGISEVSP